MLRSLLIVLLIVLVSGCATHYPSRYGDDGVYYEQAVRHHASTVVLIDPLFYPYWSLDYFYFSRYYHPYSIWVGSYDPWFYPYPGWYYGYRPGPRARLSFAFGSGFYYPWYGFGYHWHHPWGWSHVHYPRYSGPSPSRVRQVDERLRMLENRQRNMSLAGASSARGAPGPDTASVRHQARTGTDSQPDNRSLERAAVRERHRGATTPRYHAPLLERQRSTARQPLIIQAPQQRSEQGQRETRRQPDRSSEGRPVHRAPESQREPSKPPLRQAPPVRAPEPPARTQPAPPAPRAQPAPTPPAQPAPPPSRPATPVRSRPAEHSAPPRNRNRERDRHH